MSGMSVIEHWFMHRGHAGNQCIDCGISLAEFRQDDVVCSGPPQTTPEPSPHEVYELDFKFGDKLEKLFGERITFKLETKEPTT